MIELRPYQCEAIDAVRRELGLHRSTLLVLATGLGKTVTFCAIAHRCAQRGKRVLVVAHRGELLDQAAATARRFGLTVGIEQGGQRVDRGSLPEVVIASVQTLRGKRLASFAVDAFGLVVVDEAHHATAASYRQLLAHFTGARVLGVTATPDRTDRVGLRNVFASVAYRLELGAGMKGGWLAPIELRSVVVDGLDLSRVRSIAGDLAVGELEAELTRDAVLHEVAGPLAELSTGRQTIAFVAGVTQAHALADVLGGYGVKAAAVDGSMPAEARAAVLQAYRSGAVQVVCNAQLWTEGFDAPETSCVALVRPTRSRSLVTQMIGRGTRLAPGKTSCLVLDFVPGRMATVRLSSPADALAGEELADDLAAAVRAASGLEGGSLQDLIDRAVSEKLAAEQQAALEAEAAASERRRVVREVGVEYAAPWLDIADLLDAVTEPNPPDWREEWARRPASAKQLERLRSAGFDVPDTIDHKQASALFDVLSKRHRAGLCSVKQAKKLRSFGLRDDLGADAARAALDAIAANSWRPPTWMYQDERYARLERGAA